METEFDFKQEWGRRITEKVKKLEKVPRVYHQGDNRYVFVFSRVEPKAWLERGRSQLDYRLRADIEVQTLKRKEHYRDVDLGTCIRNAISDLFGSDDPQTRYFNDTLPIISPIVGEEWENTSKAHRELIDQGFLEKKLEKSKPPPPSLP